jgi:hypothetical protein
MLYATLYATLYAWKITSRASERSTEEMPRLQATYVSIRLHTSAYVSMSACQHTSAYVSMHTSGYVSICYVGAARRLACERLHVSMRQHTSAYVSIRQHTWEEVRDVSPASAGSAVKYCSSSLRLYLLAPAAKCPKSSSLMRSVTYGIV